MPRPKQRTPELRDRVLQVAVSTLNQDGLPGLTTRRVAQRADTSVPTIYELFENKAGLLRAVFFEGFRMLCRRLLAVPESDDALADVQRLIPVFRRFCLDYPALARVMFSRSIQDFDPGPAELAASSSVREIFVGKITRCTEACNTARF
jgi:AcrR family transcriptional regulator